MPDNPILRVAVPVPLRRTFDYLPPDGVNARDILPGERIEVPFGRQRKLGIVVDICDDPDIEIDRLKAASRRLDNGPTLPHRIMRLVEWAARYYHAPIGEALIGCIPVALRSGSKNLLSTERAWQLSADALGLADNALSRAPAQAATLLTVREHGILSNTVRKHLDIRLELINALVKRGLVEEIRIKDAPPSTPVTAAPASTPPSLNAEQRSALDAISAGADQFNCFLLEGVTGSGKTEVYLQAIERTLQADKQALVLIPEIGLTPQTERRFRARFGNVVAVLHSGLSDTQRLDQWRQASTGAARVVIGTRSAIFAPMPDLGIIIIDEEHDLSFKQQDGFRYSARDVAVYRARDANIPIILGSATPSAESIANASSSRYQHLILPSRAGTARPPTIDLMSTRGLELDGGICDSMLSEIRHTIESGNQVLVFINRRGWAPVLCCSDCGWISECTHCDARMTLHRAEHRLWCHHCDTRAPIPARCPGCRSARLSALGAGTERCEHVLQRHFPDTPIRRIDRSSMQSRDAMESMMDDVNRGEPCILVGTQMLAKGHHFANVTLVAVLDIDAGLFSADFRAPERTAQLLIQVAGRAGRAEKPGRVLIQTMHPEHEWLNRLATSGYRAFMDPLLEQHRAHGMPPFCNVAVLRAESPSSDECTDLLRKALHTINRIEGLDVIGPLPATMQRRAGRHRFQLLLRSASRALLHTALSQATDAIAAIRLSKDARWHIDVDPQSDF